MGEGTAVTTRTNWRIIGGAAALLATAAVLLAAFLLLSYPGGEELSLGDTLYDRFGWRYETLTNGEALEYELQFLEDGYSMALPEGTEAVRITRTMTEDFPDAELEWYTYRNGTEVFLDGRLLHSDFPGAPRDANGFLRVSGEDWERMEREQLAYASRVRITLPADYLGQELTVVTYFPQDSEDPEAVYPHLCSEYSTVASFIVGGLKNNVSMTIYAILALLMAGEFLLDARNNGGNGKTLLLCLYFLLLFFREASSYVGYYSSLQPYLDMGFLYRLYVAPLYLYLALQLKGRWRNAVCTIVFFWALYEAGRWFAGVRNGMVGMADRLGPESLAVLLVLCAGLFRRDGQIWQDRKLLRGYGLTAVVVLALYIINKWYAWGGLDNYLYGVWSTISMGNFEQIMDLFTGVISVMTVIVTVTEAARRTVRTYRTVDVLRERSRRTMESYQRVLEANDAASALHHEMRHHMTALSAILAEGDLDRASRYVNAVAGGLEQLPIGRYSQNVLVNVIVGNYLNRARAEHIQVEHHLNVPQELNIADEDLSVFLSNMLQNALEACERLGPERERYIRVDMHLRGKFLFIKCVNSAPAGEQQQERPGHGYGLAAMRAVAERYESMVVIDRAPGEFSVMSDLCLH